LIVLPGTSLVQTIAVSGDGLGSLWAAGSCREAVVPFLRRMARENCVEGVHDGGSRMALQRERGGPRGGGLRVFRRGEEAGKVEGVLVGRGGVIGRGGGQLRGDAVCRLLSRGKVRGLGSFFLLLLCRRCLPKLSLPSGLGACPVDKVPYA
jgi:hypothetical protein